MCVFHLSCSVHLDARPTHLMRIFSFHATSCTLRWDGFSSCACFIYPVARSTHLMRVFSFRATSCTLRGDGFSSCACFIYHCSVHLDARPTHLMRVFPFRTTRCTLRGDRSTSLAYFYFVQQVARYKATYPPHAYVSISCNKLHAMRRPIPHASVFIRATHCMKCGEWCFDIVYFW